MSDLTHLDEHGRARMVDISGKPATRREARAQAVVRMQRTTVDAIRNSALTKGDALAVSRIAAIQAAKRVDELIPLCHTLPISSVDIDFAIEDEQIVIMSSVSTVAPTGVEMEALTAATVAALTIYDMAKGIDKRIEIENVHLLSKTGGKSGDFQWQE
jgi:cyclic pyranopterin monophosphate synthase